MGKLKVLDFYTHQGAQYEHSKLDIEYHIVGMNGRIPNWNAEHRPLRDNVVLATESMAKQIKFDIVIVRSPVSLDRYKTFIRNGAKPVAIMQTTNHFPLPKECRHVIWNSADTMQKYKSVFPNRKHLHIVHGFDPNEFKQLNLKGNGRVLTVANAFKRRSDVMGYPLWLAVFKRIKKIDIIGHKNEDISNRIKEASTFDELVLTYNKYSVYFNPTRSSAMPRTRGEAAMCGAPIVTTHNPEISRYFTNNNNAIVSNNKHELIGGIKRLLSSEDLRVEFGEKARKIAVKHFNIKNYIDKWHDLMNRL